MNIHCGKTSISIKNRLKEQAQSVSVIKTAAQDVKPHDYADISSGALFYARIHDMIKCYGLYLRYTA